MVVERAPHVLQTIAVTEFPPPIGEEQWPRQGEWTYADYKRLPDDGWRYEIIEGELHMTPAPSTKHQSVVVNLAFLFSQFVRTHQSGKVYVAPTDVILLGLATPVQPDLLYVAANRLDIVKDAFVEGPPDLIVEVLSPSNWLVDRRVKLGAYARAGVGEYWIVDPEMRTVELFRLAGQQYNQVGRYGPGERVASGVLTGFEIGVDEICPA
jgi:Uma2 family endonuclease